MMSIAVLPIEEFFAQPPRSVSPVTNVSPVRIYTAYKEHHIPVSRIVSDLFALSVPSREEERRMHDSGAYINDNLVAAVRRLDIALSTEKVGLVEKLKVAMWSLYFDTMMNPFSEDIFFPEGHINYPRLIALESFQNVLVRHAVNIMGRTYVRNGYLQCDEEYLYPFLNVLICFAQTIFQSRPHVVPPDLILRGTLWETYLHSWGLKPCYV